MTLPLCLLFGEAKHLLVIFNQLVKAVSLVLVEGTIVTIVILDLFVEDGLEHGFRLP